jgi:glycosyltransferase involved in cell wall biosynthesis
LRAIRDIPSDVRIIGTGADDGELRAIAAEAGSASIRFLGHLPFPKLLDEIRDSLFAVCPSEWYENQPYAVLEAFAMGRPVVAARIGGLPELVRDGETGRLYEPGDADELRLRMTSLLEDPAGAARMGEEARRFVEREFVPERAYNAVLAAYGRAAGKTL